MTEYQLTIHHQGQPVLTAMASKTKAIPVLRLTAAFIDNNGDELTEHGADAFRCLALGEMIVGMALGIPALDPFAERRQHLEAEVKRLRKLIGDAGLNPEPTL
jgi:hypothetical protein